LTPILAVEKSKVERSKKTEEKMAQYKVLRPIELNGTLYLPEGATPPQKPRSAGNGKDVAVEGGGMIQLSDAQAAEMQLGQIQAIPEKETRDKTDAVSAQQSAVSKKKKS
jgi:hypothetical protein